MPETDSAETSGPFHRARLCGFDGGRIKFLQGFLRGRHQEPDRHGPAADAFTRKVGHSEVKERAESLFREIRTGLGLKRKALSFSCEDGTAVIRTPAFTVTLWIEQDPDDPRAYRIGIEVGSIADSDVIRREEFIGIFRLTCQSIVIDFPKVIDLEETIDRIEESDRLASFLDYAADASWLKLRVEGSLIEMTLQAHQARFSMPRGGDLAALIDGTAAILEDLESAGAGFFLE